MKYKPIPLLDESNRTLPEDKHANGRGKQKRRDEPFEGKVGKEEGKNETKKKIHDKKQIKTGGWVYEKEKEKKVK